MSTNERNLKLQKEGTIQAIHICLLNLSKVLADQTYHPREVTKAAIPLLAFTWSTEIIKATGGKRLKEFLTRMKGRLDDQQV